MLKVQLLQLLGRRLVLMTWQQQQLLRRQQLWKLRLH
jgi:hypothetical protein